VPPLPPAPPVQSAPSDDTFGIKYKPIRRVGGVKNNSGDSNFPPLGTPPALDDFGEDNDPLDSNFFAANNSDGHDNDFDGVFVPAIDVNEALKKARQYYTSEPQSPQLPPPPPLPPSHPSLPLVPDDLEMLLPPPPPQADKPPSEEEEEEPLDIRASAAQALDVLTDVYGRGFGDQEVRRQVILVG